MTARLKTARRTGLAVAVGLAGVVLGAGATAGASTAGPVLLGHHNHASATTTVASSKGPALRLDAPSGTPALRVDSDAVIAHLDAARLGGRPAAAYRSRGSAATSAPGSIAVAGNGSSAPALAVATATLPAGSYAVTASTLLSSSHGAYCFVATAASPNNRQVVSGGTAATVPASETLAVTLRHATSIGQWCFAVKDPGATMSDASIVATRLDQLSVGRTGAFADPQPYTSSTTTTDSASSSTTPLR